MDEWRCLQKPEEDIRLFWCGMLFINVYEIKKKKVWGGNPSAQSSHRLTGKMFQGTKRPLKLWPREAWYCSRWLQQLSIANNFLIVKTSTADSAHFLLPPLLPFCFPWPHTSHVHAIKHTVSWYMQLPYWIRKMLFHCSFLSPLALSSEMIPYLLEERVWYRCNAWTEHSKICYSLLLGQL